MPRQKTDFLLDQLTDGGFATVDAFRRSVETVCRRLHEEGWTIGLGTSSDRPVYLAEDIDLAEPGDVEDTRAQTRAQVAALTDDALDFSWVNDLPDEAGQDQLPPPAWEMDPEEPDWTLSR